MPTKGTTTNELTKTDGSKPKNKRPRLISKREFNRLEIHGSRAEILAKLREFVSDRGGHNKKAITEADYWKKIFSLRNAPSYEKWHIGIRTGSPNFQIFLSPGKSNPVSTTFEIDEELRPLPSDEEIRDNREWWRASKHAAKIEEKFQQMIRERELRENLWGSEGGLAAKLALLGQIIDHSGFSEKVLVFELSSEIGFSRMAEIMEAYCQLSPDEIEKRLEEYLPSLLEEVERRRKGGF